LLCDSNFAVRYGVLDFQATDNEGLLRSAHSLVKLQIEDPERSELLSTVPSGSLQTSRECSPGHGPNPVALTCSPSSSDRLATTLRTILGHRDLRSCFATTATLEIDAKEPDTAELTLPCSITSISPAVSQLVSRKISLSENVQPILNLTPSTPVGTAARWSSPSPPGRNSGCSTHLTMPPSSPLTESSIMSVARDDDSHASFTGNFTEIHDYLAKTMSSPALYGDESTLSSSPPYQMAMSTKRTLDDSHEVCR
jgi:hypothetical protein